MDDSWLLFSVLMFSHIHILKKLVSPESFVSPLVGTRERNIVTCLDMSLGGVEYEPFFVAIYSRVGTEGMYRWGGSLTAATPQVK